MTDLEHFERQMRRHLNHFLDPDTTLKPPARPPTASPPTMKGWQVQLIVRKGPLKPDTLFVHESDKVSKLEARLDAERAAREAGWPTIGRVHDIIRQ